MAGLIVAARTVAEVLGEWKGISAEALLDEEPQEFLPAEDTPFGFNQARKYPTQ
jgi:hypothetical protein